VTQKSLSEDPTITRSGRPARFFKSIGERLYAGEKLYVGERLSVRLYRIGGSAKFCVLIAEGKNTPAAVVKHLSRVRNRGYGKNVRTYYIWLGPQGFERNPSVLKVLDDDWKSEDASVESRKLLSLSPSDEAPNDSKPSCWQSTYCINTATVQRCH
jgi:hypothetical protein